jgi:hypothetical protein
VANEPCSEAMNTIALASSSEAEATHRNTRHESGLVLRRASKTFNMRVSEGPGATAFTRIPDLATSRATDLVIPSTACLLPT